MPTPLPTREEMAARRARRRQQRAAEQIAKPTDWCPAEYRLPDLETLERLSQPERVPE